MNYIVLYLIRALTQFTINKTTKGKTETPKQAQTQHFTVKTQNLHLEASSNNVKLQSD